MKRISHLGLQPLCPDNWLFKRSVTLILPDVGNVIVSDEPIDEDLNTDGYALAQERILRTEFADYRVESTGSFEIQSTRALWRRFSWSPERFESRVTQLQCCAAANGRGYTATATAYPELFYSLEDQFFEIFRTLVIAENPGPEIVRKRRFLQR